MLSTYGSPIVYYSDADKDPPQGILDDLKNAGYTMNDGNTITLSKSQIGRLKKEIPEVLLPFFYFPVKAKTSCKYIFYEKY